MPEFLIATPIHSVSQAYTFANGISIREVSPILWDRSIVDAFVSPKDRRKLEETRYWLCLTKDADYSHGGVPDDLYDSARTAALALQIMCPSRTRHIFLALQRVSGGYDNIGSYHPRELCDTRLSRTRFLEPLDRSLFDCIFEGLLRAESKGVVRLINPIRLLEHGLQICEHHLSTLMFVMALDMLFMAGESKNFVRRAGGFLGLDTLVFPPDSILGLQPATRVRDVLLNIYELRNVLAHGSEVPLVPYRQEHKLLSTTGGLIVTPPFYYTELMLESGLFLLTTVLRRIFTEGLLEKVSDQKQWKLEMTVFEHRYREAGGSDPETRRGREARPTPPPTPQCGNVPPR